MPKHDKPPTLPGMDETQALPMIADHRMKLKSLFVFLVICTFFLADLSTFAYSPSDVNTIFGAYNSAFYVQNGTNGYFANNQSGGETYFWSQAEEIECVIDSYEWNSNSATASMITNLLNGFISYNGVNWTATDGYNDDVMWAIIAFARGGMDTRMTNYCNLAQANFNACFARAWSTNLGGGLFWQYPYNASKNACVNGPGSIAASLMYRIYGNANYWNDASNIYCWERAVLFNSNSGAIYDNIGTNGVINNWSSTYNQGTFLGAGNFLGFTNDAALSANFTMMNLTTGGILLQYGIAGNNSGFNAIFLRWLVRFMNDRNLQSIYEPFLQLNANAAWNSRRADNLSWCNWPLPSPPPTNFYSWDCISSFEAMQAAQAPQSSPAEPVCTNYIGYWPLDATSGTVAADVSGNGDNGIVSGATWNSAGQINGCISFNGVNSYVQITNRIDNDFTIEFWVRTTQTAGTGQWYNGAGLVDGDYPGPANDFGTALVGGNFACGIGNLDTTIVSSKAINDNHWHQCVATRQQATGLVKIYVDGTLQATGYANRNTLNASSRLLFGAIASGGGYFNGSLDDVKIFNRTLSDGEVSALYNSIMAPPSAVPANLSAAGGNGQVQLTWSGASDAGSYNIKRSPITGGPYVTLTNVTSTSYTDSSVTNNHSYYYVVSGVNLAGEGPNSAETSVSPLSLVTWFKASSLTNLASGSPVSVWNDSSGNGFVATQPVGTNQPFYLANAMNGMPVVRFNATNEDYLWFYRPVQSNFTIVCVFQSTQGFGSGTLYYQGAGLVNAEVSGVVNDFGSCLFANGSVCAGTGNPDTADVSGTGFNNGQPHIMAFTRTQSSGLIGLYMDGSYDGGKLAGTESLTAPNQVVLGALQILTNYFSGDIAEVQIYNTVLPSATLLGIENSLKCEYGLTASALLTPPSGLSGSAGNLEISLSWSVVPGAAGYNLWRSTNNGSSYQLLAPNLQTASYVDANAVNGQTNFYEVAANDGCGSGATSPAIGVLLPLPALGTSISGNTMSIQWPVWAGNWQLYWATNLTPPVVWSPVTSGIATNGNTLSVSIPVTNADCFYRLSAP
jgi:predicted alpha-1,6-mannanase (GH76 family)